MDSENKVQWVYSSKNEEELIERYDEWAKTYDEDLERDFEYIGPRIAAAFFIKYVPDKKARILDAGAGTGIVGQVLNKAGYSNLEAMDMSPGMLEQARAKNVYQDLHRKVMGEPLGFATGAYNSTICVGTLTVGHAPASSLDELVRVTRPGGYIVYTLRPDVYEKNGFKEKHAALEAEGKWKLVEVSDPIQVLPKGEPDVYHQVWIYRVL
ncbi:MAG: class I SAM-dependent methyltransferase [Dehalococcoidales bacterium]|nr:class I SAM-dependent methyltransferase [Dehalococcoidales bacterium]